MVGVPQPLSENFRLVNDDGTPTAYFIQWAQQRQIDIEDGITAAQAQTLIDTWAAARDIIAGNGLSGGGNLSSDVTLTADVQEILDQITTTRGSVLYRGASGWAALAPGTSGHFLKTNGASADPAWAAGGGGSSGYPPLTPPTSADLSTAINAPTVTDGTYSMKVVAAAGTPVIRARLKSLPGGNFSVITKFNARRFVDFNGAGPIFRDSAGKYVCLHSVHNGANVAVGFDQFSNSTTFNSGVGFISFDESDPVPQWFKIDFDSTTNDLTGYWSYTGDNWVALSATSTYLATADAFGVACISNNASNGVTVFFEHWEVG